MLPEDKFCQETRRFKYQLTNLKWKFRLYQSCNLKISKINYFLYIVYMLWKNVYKRTALFFIYKYICNCLRSVPKLIKEDEINDAENYEHSTVFSHSPREHKKLYIILQKKNASWTTAEKHIYSRFHKRHAWFYHQHDFNKIVNNFFFFLIPFIFGFQLQKSIMHSNI